MEKLLFVFLHLVLPIILIIDFSLRKPASRIGLLVKTSLYTTIICFLYIWGQWPLVGSYYLRYIMVFLIIIIFVITYRRFHILSLLKPSGLWNTIKVIITALILILVIILNIKAIDGRDYPSIGKELHFPLKNGRFYVASGGSSKIINNHMRNFPNAQEFALDINKLGVFGSVSRRILSNVITDHYIFSDTIYAPCDGKIMETQDGLEDNFSGSMKVSAKDGTGNYINIQCNGDFYVFLPHLKQYSIMVEPRQEVKAGTPLALVGISGFSQEPHLHIQAATYIEDSILTGIPIHFNGRYLYRNNIIEN